MTTRALEKAQTRLQALQTNFSEQEKSFVSTQKEYRRQCFNLDSLSGFSPFETPEEKKRVKQYYKEYSKEVTLIGNELSRMRKIMENTQYGISITEMEVSAIVADARQSQEKKESIKILKKIEKEGITDSKKKKITSLPEDIVNLIGSFLPQEVILEIKIRELEFTTKTSALLGCCSKELQVAILNSFSTQREFLSLLPYDDALYQIREYAESEFRPYANCKYTKEPSLKIRQMIEMAKTSNPEFAFDMLKKLHILIDPTKKYKKAQGIRTFNVLTIEDLHEAHDIV